MTILNWNMSATWPTTRWDDGIRWRSVRSGRPEFLPVSVPYVRDQVLRVTNGSVEDEFIERSIWTANDAAEDATQCAIPRQTWQQILSGFPASGRIELVRPPFIGLTSIGYYDGDGVAQTLTLGSPAETDAIVTPSGPYARAVLHPTPGTSFPGTQTRWDAVTVTFECGYADAESIPEWIVSGIGLFVGELYKQRSLSQVGTSIVAAPLDTSRFWKRVW